MGLKRTKTRKIGKKKPTRKHIRTYRRYRRKFPGLKGGADFGQITRTVIQTSKAPIADNVVSMLKAQLTGWDYVYFSDKDILQFFNDNTLEEFPDILGKFNSFASGPHRADLFRYYYLYIKGGVFIDSDLMLYDPIESIVGTKSFVSVWALRPEGSVFNGFLGGSPKHPILYAALKDAYSTSNEQLEEDYTLFCKNLGGFVNKNAETNVKMLRELVNNDTFCKIEDPDSKKISLIHYQSMDIPAKAPDST
jgi:hypothetical protein